MSEPGASDQPSEPGPFPPPAPPSEQRWSLEALILVAGFGVSLITAGGAVAVATLPRPLQVMGVLLIVAGLGVVTAAVWPHARRVFPPRLRSQRWRLGSLGVIVVLLVVDPGNLPWGGGDDENPEVTPTQVVFRDEQQCGRIAAECTLVAGGLPGGEYLIKDLDGASFDDAPDAVLTVDARIEGVTEGRYVALGCRSDSVSAGDADRGEYVLAVWPDARRYRLLRWDGAVDFTLEEGPIPDDVNPGNETNRLGLGCVGDQISAVINGALIAGMSDRTYGSQGIWYVAAGLSDGTPSGPLSARFTDVVLDPRVPVISATPQP